MSQSSSPRTKESTRGPSGDGLRVRGLVKEFPGTVALAGVDLDLARGEIHALVGSNGSGKSTLIKILAGVYAGDAGEIEAEGTATSARQVTPDWSLAAGLGFVHQDLGLIETLTVAENLFLGLPYPRRAGSIDWRGLNRAAEAVLERLQLDVAPEQPLASLRPSDRTQVAIGRAIRGREELHSGTLVLDEPTAKLAAAEVEALLEALRGYASRGQSILYVSHRLDEILALADRITVLRDGQVVVSEPVGEFDYARLASLIAGRELGAGKQAGAARSEPTAGPPALAVRGLSAGSLRDIDLTVAPGEVVGLAGLVGSGRSTLLKAVFGVVPATGEVSVFGTPLSGRDSAAAVRAGVGYVPEDRGAEGAFLRLDVRENFAATQLHRNRRGGALGFVPRLRIGAERRRCEEAIASFSVRCSGPDDLMARLSGGNQQKLVLARWLASGTRLLLLDEPTQGIDVGARAEVYETIRRAAADGLSVLVASSDSEELGQLCDRVLVLAGGAIRAEASAEQITHHWLADHVYGHDYLEEVER